MKFLPPDDEIELYEQGFGEDLLGRKRVSQALSELLERIEDPLVIALDGRWGSGKSHFLKRWVGAHKLQNEGTATTVYFDAFSNDYLDDPLVALVGALSERLPKSKLGQINRVKAITLKLIRPAARIGLSLATFGATEALDDLGDAVAEAVNAEARQAVTEFWAREDGRRAAMDQFRAALSDLLEHGDDTGKLVIVVDELDRCRPDYALQILEVLKHFFAVPNVHFILGVNLDALENSVKARYGSEIDAAKYLQKFVSLTFSLPDEVGGVPTVIAYVKHLGLAMEMPAHVTEAAIGHLEVVADANPISIRDVGKIMSALALLPGDFLEQDRLLGWKEVVMTLVTSKIVRPNLYSKFLKATVSEEELRSYYGATDQTISEKAGDQYNPLYNRKIWVRYIIWQYITGCKFGGDGETLRIVSRQFNAWPTDEPLKIPKIAHGEWLNIFQS